MIYLLPPPPFSVYCKVVEFTRKNLEMFFPSVKEPSAEILSPSGVQVLSPKRRQEKKLSDKDSSWSASKCILSLLRSLVQGMDMKLVCSCNKFGLSYSSLVRQYDPLITGVSPLPVHMSGGYIDNSYFYRSVAGENGFVGDNCSEMVDFFRQATSSINLTSKNIAQLNKLDSQFHFYCLHLLIPSLTALFKHVGHLGVGHLLVDGQIQSHCRYIFTNLVEMAMGTGPVYVGRSVNVVYVEIGFLFLLVIL